MHFLRSVFSFSHRRTFPHAARLVESAAASSSGEVAKRMKLSVDNKETMGEDPSAVQLPGEETEPKNSEQVEMEIGSILEKINNFTQLVLELLESGKSMLKDLSNQLEEQAIVIHKEQIEKWQEEIKELRLLDSANEEIDACLSNTKYLLQQTYGGS